MLEGRAPAPRWLELDAGDDAAVIDGQAVTVDTLVEGSHFDGRSTPSDVGYKSVAVSVSDLAAMGAAPTWMVCALSLPHDQASLAWVDGFADGLHAACREYGVYLVGGDVTGSRAGSPRVVSHTLAGRIRTRPLTRSGARPGDDLWVTGHPGHAGLGWMVDAPPDSALAVLRRPRPPVAFALALVEAGWATAGMDLSDGPSTDLPRLARASGVAITLDPARLPAPPGLEAHPDLRRAQLGGGDDYELLFTASPEQAPAIHDLAHAHHTVATVIGTVREGSGVALADGPWPDPAFAHFSVAESP